MRESRNCPECGGSSLYRAEASSGGGYAPTYLPGLGPWYGSARFDIVLCQSCGLTRFFAQRQALEKVGSSSKWKRIP